MKKLLLFLIALFGVFIQLNGNSQFGCTKENAISLGKIDLEVEIMILSTQNDDDYNTFDIDSFLSTIEIYGVTIPIFGNRFSEQLHPLNRNKNRFYGEVSVERKQEIGGIRVFLNGQIQGGTHVIFKQGEPSRITLWMLRDGSIQSVNYTELSEDKLVSIADITSNSVSANPFMFFPPDLTLYDSWKDIRSFQINSVWPTYLKESIGTASIPEEMEDWIMNNLKITFATYCILPYVKRVKETIGLIVPEPPMEAYTFLDSIDYSPDVFLKTNMLISPRSF